VGRKGQENVGLVIRSRRESGNVESGRKKWESRSKEEKVRE